MSEANDASHENKIKWLSYAYAWLGFPSVPSCVDVFQSSFARVTRKRVLTFLTVVCRSLFQENRLLAASPHTGGHVLKFSITLH